MALAMVIGLLPIFKPNIMYSGEVRNLSGEPIPDVSINLIWNESPTEKKLTGTTLTDSEGKFEIHPDHIRPNSILAQKEGYHFYFSDDFLKYWQPIHFIGWTADTPNMAQGYYTVREQALNNGDTRIELDQKSAIQLKIHSFINKDTWQLKISMDSAVLSSVSSFEAPHYTDELIFTPLSDPKQEIPLTRVFFAQTIGAMTRYGWIRFTFTPYLSRGNILSITDWGINLSGQRNLIHPSSAFHHWRDWK